jgi:uncharacterized protein YebE (UPF0316 family)
VILTAMALIQILYVSLNSLRVVLMIKGKKITASLISMGEVFVYITGLTIVLDHLDSPIGIILYSASYGIGIFLGIFIEQKIAIGYIAVQVISETDALANVLREQGYGITSWVGNGANGMRMVHLILTKRKKYQSLKAAIQLIDDKAFLLSFEASHFMGGYWSKKLR